MNVLQRKITKPDNQKWTNWVNKETKSIINYKELFLVTLKLKHSTGGGFLINKKKKKHRWVSECSDLIILLATLFIIYHNWYKYTYQFKTLTKTDTLLYNFYFWVSEILWFNHKHIPLISALYPNYYLQLEFFSFLKKNIFLKQY